MWFGRDIEGGCFSSVFCCVGSWSRKWDAFCCDEAFLFCQGWGWSVELSVCVQETGWFGQWWCWSVAALVSGQWRCWSVAVLVSGQWQCWSVVVLVSGQSVAVVSQGRCWAVRCEEDTSEVQSRLRIWCAVLCLTRLNYSCEIR